MSIGKDRKVLGGLWTVTRSGESRCVQAIETLHLFSMMVCRTRRRTNRYDMLTLGTRPSYLEPGSSQHMALP